MMRHDFFLEFIKKKQANKVRWFGYGDPGKVLISAPAEWEKCRWDTHGSRVTGLRVSRVPGMAEDAVRREVRPSFEDAAGGGGVCGNVPRRLIRNMQYRTYLQMSG